MENITNMRKAILVDLDGTLARKLDREIFDYSRVHEDLIDPYVADTVKMFHRSGYDIVILTGREGTQECVNLTMKWLHHWGIPFSSLFFRGVGDRRPDTETKLELYNEHIKPIWEIVLALDDRPRIIKLWRDLGINTWDVGNGVEF